MTVNREPDSLTFLTLITKLNENFRVIRRRSALGFPPGGGGGTLEISGWGYAAGTPEPLTYTELVQLNFATLY